MIGTKLALCIILLACGHFGHTEADCVQDQEDGSNQLGKRQFSIETTWMMFNTMPNRINQSSNVVDGYIVENKIRKRLNETLDGDRVVVFVNITGRNKLIDLDTVSFKATFSTDERPTSIESILSADLLRTLSNLVDCNQEYRSGIQEAGPYCELVPANGLLVTKSYTESSAIVGSVRLWLVHSMIGNENDKCDRICNQITSSRPNIAKFGRELFVKLHQGAVVVVSILDPHHWLALVVGIWLTTCFFIAMFIKRRDKRRLRLYLEERTDYSFSAKRKDST